MSGDGGRRKQDEVPKPLGPSGGNPPLYEGGGTDYGGKTGASPDGWDGSFDALNLDTGATVRIVEKRGDGVWLDGAGAEYRPHPHRLGVVPVV